MPGSDHAEGQCSPQAGGSPAIGSRICSTIIARHAEAANALPQLHGRKRGDTTPFVGCGAPTSVALHGLRFRERPNRQVMPTSMDIVR
jgi:hypothetical protein